MQRLMHGLSALFPLLLLRAIASQSHAFDTKRFRELRDQGIKNYAWVAGNAAGDPIWPSVEKDLGKGGVFYHVLVHLKTPGASDALEAQHNLNLYWEWHKKGEQGPTALKLRPDLTRGEHIGPVTL